jgi:hypothetical protein
MPIVICCILLRIMWSISIHVGISHTKERMMRGLILAVILIVACAKTETTPEATGGVSAIPSASSAAGTAGAAAIPVAGTSAINAE